METIVQRPAALDVHKEHVTACVRVPGDGGREQHVVEFSTTVAGLLTLRDWLAAYGVTQVTMEATGVFLKPVWAI
jgi:hypothetical protein